MQLCENQGVLNDEIKAYNMNPNFTTPYGIKLFINIVNTNYEYSKASAL